MTKKEMFALIAAVNADNEEIVSFCNREIELLSNRKASKTPTKTQRENEGVIEQIVIDLAEFGKPVTVTELIAGGEGMGGFTNQKVSALLRKLVLEGKVVKTIEGKKAYFAVA